VRVLMLCSLCTNKYASTMQSDFRNSVFESPATLKEGYMFKKSSGAVKRWQRRYFVLQTHYLKYYDKEACKNDQSEIKGTASINQL
jgi:hypothetical protein